MFEPRLRRILPLLILTIIPLPLSAQRYPWMYFQLGANGPSLDGTTLVNDTGTNQIIAFGGLDSGECCNSENYVWLLTNANGIGGAPSWVEESPAGTPPAPRALASAVYDQKNNVMVVFGGGQFNGYDFDPMFNDVWVLENANGKGGTPTWLQLNPSGSGAPAPRTGHMATYDSTNNIMTIFGGANNGIMDVPNDVWVLTNANGLNGQPEWIQLQPTGNLPAARETFAMAYDPVANEDIVFGGCCPSYNDVWVLGDANGLNGTPAWTQVSPMGTPPDPRQNNGSFGYDVGTDYHPTDPAYDAGTNSLAIFGGLGYNPSGTFYNDVWFLENADSSPGTPAWKNPYVNDLKGFPPRSVPPGVFDNLSKRLIVLEDTSDLWLLTTRNGIDVSCSAPGKEGLTKAILTQIQQAGIQGVAVKTPQFSSSNCPKGVDGIQRAREQLDAFSGFEFKTGAYCLLLFRKTDAGTGTKQADRCLATIQKQRYSTIAFVALDVEGASELNQSDAAAIVTEASGEINSVLGKMPPIYTFPDDWNRIIGSAGDFSGQPLWARLKGTFYDAGNNAHCGDGVPALGPLRSAKFGGWKGLSGKQFDLGIHGCSGTSLATIPVDFDVFGSTLFP